MNLIRADQSVPATYHEQEVVIVPAIDRSRVSRVECEWMDVTCLSDGRRRFMPGPAVVYDHFGNELISGHHLLINAALDGGGAFKWIDENGTYWVQAREEHEAELEADAEADALSWW